MSTNDYSATSDLHLRTREKKQAKIYLRQNNIPSLFLVSSGLATSTSALELASPGPGEGLHVRVGQTGGAELSLCHALLARSLQHESVSASGSSESQLIEGDDFSSGLQDPFAGLLGAHVHRDDPTA